MAGRLNSSAQVWKLARDLGLKTGSDPVAAIIRYCERRVEKFLEEFPHTTTLTDFLDVVAASLRTKLEVIRSDEDLDRVRATYVKRGERIFANLAEELSEHVFGVTFRLSQREPWEPLFVSVVDCRGEKGWREFFTAWHELAHILVLTDQMRLSFRRTHAPGHEKDPEEQVVDVIAGHFGFYPPLIRPLARGPLTFEKIEALRAQLCSTASREASINGFVTAWPRPCLLLRAKLGRRKAEERIADQDSFSYYEVPAQALRAVNVIANAPAREADLVVRRNMRVPDRSVMSRVFAGEMQSGEAEEDLSWWNASDGTVLSALRVRVEARRTWDAVEALIQPS